MITIFTPVYNRADIIKPLYESIKLQTFKDFEWLIVDDGSKDNIEEVVQSFINEGVVDIRFYSQPNGGKHRAINKGVELAKGDLFFIVDSDDTITPDALKWLDYYHQQVKDDDRFAGVSGYRCLPDGSNVYNHPKNRILDCTNLEFAYKYNQVGGTAEAYKTKVLRNFPFPDIEGEKFCAESLVWNRIAEKYMIRFFNESIYVWNFLPEGLTAGSIRNRKNSPTYAMLNYSEQLERNITISRKIKCAINYWRFYFVKKHKRSVSIPFVWYAFAPMGYILNRKDKSSLAH